MPGNLAELRKRSPDIPVFLASGYGEAQVMSETQTERPQAFLGKPYGREQLETAIQQALSGREQPTSG